MSIPKKIVNAAANVMSAPSRAVSAIKAGSKQWDLANKMMAKKGLVPGVMGSKNYDKAFGNVDASIKQGNMVKARNYTQDQAEKITKQKYGLK